ncbi:hypothetical protein BgiMline_004419 [Biomphalaria glabrata]|nr:interferon-induced protein with tetratricopeptide repeats 5-like [Biomphalaria glabrata]
MAQERILAEGFPCNFNLITGNKVSQQRFKYVKTNVTKDLELSDSSLEEHIRDLNLLTWVLFNLNEKNEAMEKNTDALALTKRKNITALGNLVHISRLQGYTLESKRYLEELLVLKEEPDFEQLRLVALSEQAYSYSRLGGLENYKLCRQCFLESTLRCPDNYLWKYGLALTSKRLTNCNIQCYSDQQFKADELVSECVILFFEIGEKADRRLRGLAFGQLVNLRQNFFMQKYDKLFKFYNLQNLCNKALEFGGSDPAVLTQCGKSLKSINIDRAIQSLRKSLDLRENNIAYHHLGLSLLRKSTLIAEGKYHLKRPGQEKNYNGKSAGNVRKYGFNSKQLNSATDTRYNKFKLYTTNPFKELNIEDELVKEAIECFKKAIEISHEENVPAKQTLADVYFSTGQFEHALALYNQIIDQTEGKFLLCLISAHHGAGQCLQKLSEAPGEMSPETRQHFLKAVSFAVDVASKNAAFANSEIMIWESLRQLLEDNETTSVPKERIQRNSKLFELVKNKDIAVLIRSMLDQGPDVDDVEMFRRKIITFLTVEDYEGALAFLNLVSLNSDLVNNPAWTSLEITELKSRTYLMASWARLVNQSSDFRRVFQQEFLLIFGQCEGMVSEEEDEVDVMETLAHDVLLMTESRSGDISEEKTNLTNNLYHMLKNVFGLSVVMKNTDFANETMNPVIENCCLIVMIVGPNDSKNFEQMLETIKVPIRAETVVISLKQNRDYPKVLKRKRMLDLKISPWKDTRLLTNASEEENTGLCSKWIIQKLFDGNPETLMQLFYFLVGEDFEKRMNST